MKPLPTAVLCAGCRRVVCALTVLVSFFLAATTATGKRAAPKPVPAVTANSMEYSAPHEQMGYVVAIDTASHKELWRERIDRVPISPALERDVQDVLMISLVLKRGALVITNELGDIYTLDLATRHVIKRK